MDIYRASKKKPASYFADPRRATAVELEHQISAICEHPLTTKLLRSLNGAAVILNQYRQVIAANDTLLDSLGISDPKTALGLRPGEALSCKHALLAPNGCGTGKVCSTCGAVLAIVTSQQAGYPIENECYITACRNGIEECFEFQVRAAPLEIGKHRFLVVTLIDIRRQKWAQAMERIFLHDMVNYLQALRGSCDLLCFRGHGDAESHLIEQIRHLSEYITETTTAHRDFILMESGKFKPSRRHVSVQSVFERVTELTAHLSIMKHRTLEIAPIESDPNPILVVDSVLLVRILVNMVKNALEATQSGESVRLWYESTAHDHCFKVWNKAEIPEEVGMRIFQRYFSTKDGRGRGLGTYSMKLLGERYLGGEVRFRSSSGGTIFEFLLKK